MAIDIVYVDGANPDFVALCTELDEHLTEVGDVESYQDQYKQYNTLDDIHDAFVAYMDGRPVGCVSFKQYAPDGAAEVKRMFVRDECRGMGVARLLLSAVEKKAAEKGYGALILETGRHLVAAQTLYKSIGFAECPNFDQYVDMANSVCMRKVIVGE